jgi:hypothetical protein
MAGQNIISIYPELEAYEVEISGEKFDCRRCMGIGDCCGTVMVHNNKSSCHKCKCQSLYNSTNRMKDGAKKTNSIINQTNCKNCDNSTFTEDYCKSLAYLENNLSPEIIDCSNTLLVTGEHNTLEDIKLRSQCNIDGQESVDVVTAAEDTQSSISGASLIPKDYLIYGGIGFVIFIIIYFLFF